jgi:hypothetical protein
MTADLPPRVAAAEVRARIEKVLDASPLGAPHIQAQVEGLQRYTEALPDRWTQLSEPELIDLLGLYRDRRETWCEDHETAVAYVLTEVDFEPSQGDLCDRHRR